MKLFIMCVVMYIAILFPFFFPTIFSSFFQHMLLIFITIIIVLLFSYITRLVIYCVFVVVSPFHVLVSVLPVRRYAVVVLWHCVRVHLCLSKWMNESNRFLACRLPFTCLTLYCKEILVLLKRQVLPSRTLF